LLTPVPRRFALLHRSSNLQALAKEINYEVSYY
jgi:hypothetical protein